MRTRPYFRCCIYLCAFALICGETALYARGQIAPPPPFMGGNAGAWLGSGPLFGSDNPLGPNFFLPPGFGDDPPGGYGWDPGAGTGGGAMRGGLSCPGACKKESWTGPCKLLCECYGQSSDNEVRDTTLRPGAGAIIYGRCELTGAGDDIGGCTEPGWQCSYVQQ